MAEKSPDGLSLRGSACEHGQMKIAITGSSGLIGSALHRSLTTDGHEVVRVVRPTTKDRSGAIIEWDLERGTIDAEAFNDIDAVVHLAGEGIAEKRWSDEQKRRIRDSRVDGTTLLATAIAECSNPPSALLSGSAIGYYGDRDDEQLTEASSPGSGFLADVVTAWEQATAPAAAATRVVHLRTGIVLDEDEGALAEQLPFFKLGLGGKIGDGQQWWSWIALTDIVGAIRYLLDNDIDGAVNLTAPNPVRHAEFAKALGSALHRPAILPTPKLALNIKLGAELAEALLFTSARVVPSVLEQQGYTFVHPDLPGALTAILDE